MQVGDAARACELNIEAGVSEVGVKQTGRQAGRKPSTVERERLLVGEPQPLDVDELRVGWERQPTCDFGVTYLIAGENDAALGGVLLANLLIQ